MGVLLYCGTFGCCRSGSDAAITFKLKRYFQRRQGRSLRLNHVRFLLLCRAGGQVPPALWRTRVHCFLPIQPSSLAVLDIRVCIILGAMEVFPFYRRYVKKQINQQKHPPEPQQKGPCMENMIMFGTLGSGKQEGEFQHGSRHLFLGIN